jgi:protocatechuate 3,4-dioxygenase beta subunit
MPRSMMSRRSIWLFSIIVIAAGAAFAQFTASIQGDVKDQSGAGVAKAKIQLVNTATGVTAIATSDDSGNYSFVSLAPGRY